MKKLVILGAGTAGTMMLNKLHHELEKDEWEITIIDQYKTHYYQPGFLFIPFGIYSKKDVSLPKKVQIPKKNFTKINSPSGFSIYEYGNLVFSS